MQLFNNINENPLDKKVGDCVIRALATITQRSWDKVFMDLCEIAFDLKAMPNSQETYEVYLDRYGFERVSIKVTKGSRRPTVTSFTKEHKQGSYLLRVANHVVAVKDGQYHDSWDSGDCCLYTYYKKIDK